MHSRIQEVTLELEIKHPKCTWEAIVKAQTFEAFEPAYS